MMMQTLIQTIRKQCQEGRDIVISHAGDLDGEPRMNAMNKWLDKLEALADQCERTLDSCYAPKSILVAIEDELGAHHLLNEAIEWHASRVERSLLSTRSISDRWGCLRLIG